MLRNNRDGYGLVAIALHWAIALLFIGQLVFGLVMVRIADQRLSFDLIQWHKSFGFLLLGLVLVRLLWRLANPRPDDPATLAPWERIAARTNHRLLYVLMFALPLSGWALVSVSVLAIPTFAFYLVVIPHLPLEMSEAAEDFWDETHELLAYIAIALVAVHVLASLRHHFWLRDDVLRRMIIPAGGRMRKKSSP